MIGQDMTTIVDIAPKKKRGGARFGAGRKRTGQTICLVLSMDEKEKAKSIGQGSLVEGIKKAIQLFRFD